MKEATAVPDYVRDKIDLEVARRMGDASVHGLPRSMSPTANLSKYERIVAGDVATIGQLAQKSRLTRRYVRRILQCANLSPRITEALLAGHHRPNLTLKEMLCGVPLTWQEQEKRILRAL